MWRLPWPLLRSLSQWQSAALEAQAQCLHPKWQAWALQALRQVGDQDAELASQWLGLMGTLNGCWVDNHMLWSHHMLRCPLVTELLRYKAVGCYLVTQDLCPVTFLWLLCLGAIPAVPFGFRGGVIQGAGY